MFNVVFDFFITFMIATFVIFNYHFLFGKVVNFLNIFLGLYYIVIILSSLQLFDFNTPSPITYYYLGLALFFIELFSVLFLSIKLDIKPVINVKHVNISKLVIISLVILVLMIPSTIEGINILKTYGFTGIRSAAFSTEVYSSYTKIFLTYFLFPLNKVVFIYSLIEVVSKKNTHISLIISIINMIQCVLIFGGRSVLLDTILLIVIILYIKNGESFWNIIKNHLKFVLLICLILLFITNITSERNISKSGGFLINLYTYYVGSIHLLDYFIVHPEISLLDGNHLLYGASMFSPFFDIFKILGKAIFNNLDYKTGIEIINERVQLFFNVGGNIKMNNNITFLYICLRDFDVLGLIIGPAYISAWYSFVYKFYIKRSSVLSDALYYYLCSILPYFIFNFQISNTPVFMTIIFIVLVYFGCYDSQSNLFYKKIVWRKL